MYKQLIINVNEHETRVALLEDGTIVELHVDRGDDSDIAGNIYKGRVLRVLPGMQAAFVDIGLNQAAFIYVDDVYHNNFKDIERFFALGSEENGAAAEEEALPLPPQRRDFPIEELLNEARKSWCRWPNRRSGPRVPASPLTSPSPGGFSS